MLKQQLHIKKSPEDLLIEQKSINKEITQMQKLQTNSGKKAAYFCKELNYLYPAQGTTGSILFHTWGWKNIFLHA